VSLLRTHSSASAAHTHCDRHCHQNHTSGSRLHLHSSEGSHFRLHSVHERRRKTLGPQTRVSCGQGTQQLLTPHRGQVGLSGPFYCLSAANAVTGSWAGHPRHRGLIPWRCKTCVCPSKHPDRIWRSTQPPVPCVLAACTLCRVLSVRSLIPNSIRSAL
jgi:hypothetical protein